MSSDLYFEGKKYISSKRASDEYGYTRDYIGQLIRGNKVDAKMIGRSWFVSVESLDKYQQSFDASPKASNLFTSPSRDSGTRDSMHRSVSISEEAPFLPPLKKDKREVKVSYDTNEIASTAIFGKIAAGAVALALIVGTYFAGSIQSVAPALTVTKSIGESVGYLITQGYVSFIESVDDFSQGYMRAIDNTGVAVATTFGSVSETKHIGRSIAGAYSRSAQYILDSYLALIEGAAGTITAFVGPKDDVPAVKRENWVALAPSEENVANALDAISNAFEGESKANPLEASKTDSFLKDTYGTIANATRAMGDAYIYMIEGAGNDLYETVSAATSIFNREPGIAHTEAANPGLFEVNSAAPASLNIFESAAVGFYQAVKGVSALFAGLFESSTEMAVETENEIASPNEPVLPVVVKPVAVETRPTASGAVSGDDDKNEPTVQAVYNTYTGLSAADVDLKIASSELSLQAQINNALSTAKLAIENSRSARDRSSVRESSSSSSGSGSASVDGTTITGVNLAGTTIVSGTLRFSGLDCSGNFGGGALTTDSSGNVVCSDDDDSGAASFSTTSTAYFLSVNQGNAFSTTSATYFLSQNQGNAHSTTSADYWLSTKSLGGFSTTSADYYASIFRDFSIQGSGYLAPTTTRGLIVNASSTIGNGTQTGGLTISGGATTTGNQYFAGNIGIGRAPDTSTYPLSVSYDASSPLYGSGIAISNTNFAGGAGLALRDHSGSGTGFVGYFNGGSLWPNSVVVGARRDASANIVLGDLDNNTTILIANTSTNNVGIGTTSPFARLSVTGNAYIAGNLTATGTLAVSGATNLTGLLSADGGIIYGAGIINENGIRINNKPLSFYAANGSTLQASLASAAVGQLYTAENFGVGTTSPFERLSIAGSAYIGGNLTATGTATTTNLTIGSITGSTQCLRVNSLGQVSGTGSDCGSGSGGAAYPFGGTNNSTSTLTQFNAGLTAYASSTIGNGNQNGGLTISGGATTTGNLRVNGRVGINTNPDAFSYLSVGGDISAAGSNIYAGALFAGNGSYFINSSGALRTAGIEAPSTGNVGIGTTSPFAKLSVAGSAYIGGNLTATGTAVLGSGLNVTGDTVLAGYATIHNTIYVGTNGSPQIDSGGATLVLRGSGISFTPRFSGGWVEDMFLSSSGNLGLGTSSPFERLSIAGSAYIGGNLTATGTATTTNLTIGSITGSTQCLRVNSLGQVSGTGSDCGSGSGGAAYPFGGTNNSTSTLTQFNAGLTAYASSTIGNGNQNGGLTISGGATTTGNHRINGFLSVNSPANAFSELEVNGRITITTGNALAFGAAGGNGSARIIGSGLNGGSDFIAFQTAFSEKARLDNAGNFGIGTTSPYAKLSVVGEAVAANFTATSTTATSTFAGGLNVGNGAIVYDYSTGVTSISGASIGGSLNFDTDAGKVSWMDLPISSSASAGTVQSYTAHIDSSAILTVYGEADGSGGLQNGRVGIGTTSPQRGLHVYRSTDGAPVRFEDANGYCEIDPTSTSWTCTSDASLKKDISHLDTVETLERMAQLQAVSFKWNKDDADDPLRYGFIAQDVEQIFPELVTMSAEGVKSVSYGGFTPFIIEAVKALNLSISSLTNRVASIESRLAALEGIAGIASSSFSFATTSATSTASSTIETISGWLSSLGTAIENAVAKFVSVIADSISTKKLAVGDSADYAAAGITILDRVTGQPFCIFVANGVMQNQAGECVPGAVPGTGASSDNGIGSGTPINPGGDNIEDEGENDNGTTTPSVPELEPVEEQNESETGTTTPATAPSDETQESSETDEMIATPEPVSEQTPVEEPVVSDADPVATVVGDETVSGTP